MEVKCYETPRVFSVGRESSIVIKDCGRIILKPDEQVTFLTESGAEYDVVRKEWGYYATPSANGRLKAQGFKTAVVRNPQNRYYILLVEENKLQQFYAYLKAEASEVVEWLDEQ